MYDYHVHSCFSTDSDASLDSIFENAINNGLKGICLTDHIDYQHSMDSNDFTFNPTEYFKVLKDYKNKYKNILDIYIGVELGIQDTVYKECHELLNNNDFDFVLMSQHMIDGVDLYDREIYKKYSLEDAILKYYKTVLRNISGFNNYNCLGHLDLIRRYDEDAKEYNMHQFKDIIEEILRKIIENEKGIEINAGGYRYNLNAANPDWWIVEMYYELGGRIITLGSDAHKAEGVGTKFAFIKKELKKIGFTKATYFEKRKPKFYNL